MWKYLVSLWILSTHASPPIEAILTDIEGTTTSISFVYDVLFPYIKEGLQDYLILHQDDPEVSQIMDEVAQIAQIPHPDVGSLTQTLLTWMQQDKKITPLKTLQGMMWETGYTQGDFQGHVYEDAYQQFKRWKEKGLALYVYSSGSVSAQKLLFSHSTYGDLSPLFSGYFDTKIGGKRDSTSYCKIAEQLNLSPEKILFLSDTLQELDAASKAGMQTCLILRDAITAPVDSRHPSAPDFSKILR